MPTIQSNSAQAKEYSQLLLTKAQALEEVALPATMDYQTTVAGNQTAHQVIEKVVQFPSR